MSLIARRAVITRIRGAPPPRGGEVAPCDFAAEYRWNAVGWCFGACDELLQHGTVSGPHLRDRVARHVEDDLEVSHAAAPESWEILAALQRTRMQQPIAACRIRGDGKAVASGIRELHVHVLLHTEVATRGRHAIEGGREDTVFDGHALRASVQEDIEACAAPRLARGKQLIHRELDGQRYPPCAQSEELRGGVLIEAVDGIVGDDVAPFAAELRQKTKMPRQQWQPQVEPLGHVAALLGTHDGWRAQAKRDAARRELAVDGAHPTHRRRRMA